MSELEVNGARIHYDERGAGSETVVFSHGLLFSGDMFAAQIEALHSDYRCIAYDHRGQGRSEVTAGSYDMDRLTVDAGRLIEGLGAAPCHFVGLSMGGFVGLRLAIRRPELLRSLILLDTTADPEPPENLPRYRMLNFVARWLSIGLVMDRVLPIMFGPKFLDDPARRAERDRWATTIKAADRVGLSRAVAGVLDRQGVHEQLDRVKCPTLIVVGDQDTATPLPKSERLHAAIPHSRLVVVAGAGHSSCIEEPYAVNTAIRDFLSTL